MTTVGVSHQSKVSVAIEAQAAADAADAKTSLRP